MNEANLGRFDTAESLLKAYNSLNKEFTKKSQKLKEYEREIENLRNQLNDENLHFEYAKNALKREDFIKENVLKSDDIRRVIIEEYLASLMGLNSPKILTSLTGSTVLSPPSRPRSLKEAKKLAEIILNS